MSPEQAEMSGLDIDTRSDIYSLGVLFMNYLTGDAFPKEELLAGGIDAIRQRIREEEPAGPRPGLARCSSGWTIAANRRQTDPAKLDAYVQWDLDWIVMKCLEKDRTRRYETANGLAMDLRRFIANEPCWHDLQVWNIE